MNRASCAAIALESLARLVHGRIARILSISLATGAIACNSVDLPSSTKTVTGSGLVYELTSADGKGLPAQIAAGDITVSIRRGNLTLAPDSTWIVSHALSTGQGSQVTTLRGVYTRAGSTLTLYRQATTQATFSGTWTQNAVTLLSADGTVVGTTFTYAR